MMAVNSNSVANGSKRPRLSSLGQDEEEAAFGWVVKSSRQARDCVNPVRSCEEKYFKEPMEKRNKDKELIKLSIGERLAGFN